MNITVSFFQAKSARGHARVVVGGDPVTEPDMLEGDQETMNRAGHSRGSPSSCRGLPCAEFKRMEEKVQQIKTLMAQSHHRSVSFFIIMVFYFYTHIILCSFVKN